MIWEIYTQSHKYGKRFDRSDEKQAVATFSTGCEAVATGGCKPLMIWEIYTRGYPQMLVVVFGCFVAAAPS